MALNEILEDADNISLPVATGTLPGVAVISGGLIGVTQTKEAEGGNKAGFASVTRKCSHSLPVTGALAAIGTPVYIPPAGGALTATATANTLFGYAGATKGAGTAPVAVILSRV